MMNGPASVLRRGSKIVRNLRGMSTSASDSKSRVVWAWNEFDPLEEIIVGIADGSSIPPREPGHLTKIWHLPNTLADMGTLRPQDKVEKAGKELDNLAAVLEARGVTVRRPVAPENVAVSTPYFES